MGRVSVVWLGLVLPLLLGGCPGGVLVDDDDASADDDVGDDDAGGDDDTGGGDDTSGDDDGGDASFGSGSNFESVDGMFAYLNEQRAGYWSHERWRGLPFYGSSHTTYTWPEAFQWDAGLAADAQAEADAVAGGASPSGYETDGNPGTEHLWIDGVDTARYMVSGREAADIWGSQESALGRENGFMRMAVYYHDPGGEGPVLERVGIGAADEGAGHTWWVLLFE